ncbi:hypothetical protein ACWEOE_31660 [Amycolatopsis sp. NPDC004368]
MGQPLDANGATAARTPAQHGTDLAEASTEDLVSFVGHLARNANTVQIVVGRLVAEVLSRRALTLRELEDETGVPKSTLGRWAAPFRPEVAG